MTSARYTNAEHTSGVFVRPNGQEVHGPLPPNAGDIRFEYDAWIAAGNEPEAYEAPPAPPPPPISDRQFFQQLAVLGLITEEEALLACEGKVPASLDALVETLPQEQRFPARMFLKGATEFLRDHPMTAMLGAAMWGEAADEQLDAIWQAAGLL